MRALLCFLSVLVCCGKGELNDESKTPTSRATMPAPVFDASPDKPQPSVPAPKPTPKRWVELVERTNVLEKAWSTLEDRQRVTFYEEWTRSTQELLNVLREDADPDELDTLYHREPRHASLQFSAEEGFAYAARVSPSWLLQTFPGLPKSEKEYLTWIDLTNRDGWFAEGMLEVSVSDITRSYAKGAVLLSRYKDGFRAADIGEELDAMAIDISSLLTQPPTYAKKKYQRELRSAFDAMAKVERHAVAAKTLITKFPANGVPYAYNEVEALREELGLLK